MKRMLINATQEEELRVAMVDGQKLYDLDIESPSREQRKSNIYKGRITRIEPSLDAAFVDYGSERHGFLPIKEISREYFVAEPESGGRINIRELLREGQEIVVQVDKEERGNKGAALTTFISLAGRFIVLMPNNPRGGGVSRRISGEERDEIREAMHDLEVPGGMGVIIRTAGVGRSIEELNWDMAYLLSIWEAIKKAIVGRPAPFLVFQDSNAIIRALRDHLANDVGEILVDDPKTHEEARQFMERVMPQNLRKLRLYQDPVPLFTRFQIESQIESAFSHTVTLPSGGSLVIEQTEALVSIDINSARATKGEDIEATAFATNLEAADEVARQCRLRDLGGLLVVDFIDMASQRNQREVENRLRDAMHMDRARVQIGRISRFGLLELSRQRLRPSLGESAHLTCPRCNGAGYIRGVESLALAVLRIVGEEARKDRSAKIIAQLPVDVATYLLNEKRDWIRTIEERDQVQVILVANPSLETPNYTLRRVRDDQVGAPENVGSSYSLAAQEQPPSDAALDLFAPRIKPEEPAVVPTMPASPAPPSLEISEDVQATQAVSRPAPSAPGLMARFFAWLTGKSNTPAGTAQPGGDERRSPSRQRNSHDGGRHRGQHGRSRRDDHQRGGRGGGHQRDRGDQREARDQRGPRPQRPGHEGGRGSDRQGPGQEQRQGQGQPNRQDQRRYQDNRPDDTGARQQARGGGDPRPQPDDQAQQPGQQGQSRRRERSRSRRRGGRGGGGEDRQHGNRGPNQGSYQGTSQDQQQLRENPPANGSVPVAAPPAPQSRFDGGSTGVADSRPSPQESQTSAAAAIRQEERPALTNQGPAQGAAGSAPRTDSSPPEIRRPVPPPAETPGSSAPGSAPKSYTVWSSGPGSTDRPDRDSGP